MKFNLKPIVAAVLATGFGSAAYASNDIIQASGASAFRGTAEGLVVGFCNTGSVTKYVSGVVNTFNSVSHSGDVTRIICTSTNTLYGINNTLDFSYDSFGGSWKGFTASNSISIPIDNTVNQTPVQTVNTVGCTGATSTVTIAGVTLSQIAGCGEIAPQTPGGVTSIGFTDVEPALFFGTVNDQPGHGVTFPAKLGATSQQVPLLGVTWAVAASKPLWLALEADQSAAGILPASCATNIDESNQVCAPFITKAQYRSIVQGAGDGDLHFDLVNLFTGTAPSGGVLTLERRDLGSGTQSASNAYFLNEGCSSAALIDIQASVAAGMTVNINPSTGQVKNGLKADVYGIGVFSADNCPTAATTFSGTTAGSYGCLKLPSTAISALAKPSVTGAVGYPLASNVVVGMYDYTSEEQMYVRSGASAAETNFANQLEIKTAAFTTNAGFYNLTGITTQPMTVPTTGTYYRVGSAAAATPHAGGSNMCAGLVDTF